MNQKGIAPLIIAIVAIVVVAAASIGIFVVMKGSGGGQGGGEGGTQGTLPIYSGAQETNDDIAQQAITNTMTQMGSPPNWSSKAYTTTASPQTVINWYKTQMSEWTKISDNVISQDDTALYVVFYTKGDDATLITTFSAPGHGNYLILLYGPKPPTGGGPGGENGENQPPVNEYVVTEYTAGTYSGYKSQLSYGKTYYTVRINYDLVNLVNDVTLPFRVRLWNDGVGVTHNATSIVNINGFNYASWDSATSSAYMEITITQQAAVYDDQGGSFVSDNFGWLSSEVCHGDTLIDTQDSTVKSVANSIRSASTTPYEVAKSVAIWMADNEQIMYGKPSGLASNVNKTPSEVLSTKEGDCIELSTLYASVCRAAGVPTRIVWAFTENGTSPFSHVWTEFYDGEKWIPVDMTDMIMYHSGPARAALGPVSDWFGFVDARDIAIYVENSSSTGLSQIYSDSKNFEDAMPIYTRTGSGTLLETAKLEIYNTGRRELVFTEAA
jgi:transglutaminase-like putative cysteine protease